MRNISHIFCNFAPNLKRKVSFSSRNRQLQVTQKTQMQPIYRYMWAAVLCLGTGVWRCLRANMDGGPLPLYKYLPFSGSEVLEKTPSK